ncbi:MAG: S8 family serine peptidase [Clostridia bacterium]|nr:S8 family serine peptidase [Clostridia bacterium]
MKKVISFVTAFILICFRLPPVYIAVADNSGDGSYLSQLSEMIRKYDSEDYFATMSVTIGESDLVIDGEVIPIDESGSVAYVENGRTMMPVRGIAEAIGAEVSYDNDTQTVTVENEDTMIAMTIGENEMEVNGQSVMLLNAPEIKDERTMLPVRDVAEALDCEVEWQQETQTATFTRAYQTKRVIVNSEQADVGNAIDYFSADGKTVIQFASIDDAKNCVEINSQKGLTAEPDYIRTIQGLSWGYDMIGGESYYNQTSYYGGSAIVAVIDSGIDYNHEMFKNRIVDGHDFYFNDNYCEDKMGHGTHVSSTVLDIAGNNKNIKIMPLKVFGDSGTASSSVVAEAIKYAADNGADVINLSLGGQHEGYLEREAVNYANSKNVAVVAAAGNESADMTTTPFSPGGLDGVITVSNVTKDLKLNSKSNYGEGIVEFAAPGTNIKGAKVGGGYCNKSGTSMASPHIAGAYALVKAVHPEMTTNEITAALEKNATKIGSSKYFGAGLIKVDMLEKYLSNMYFSDIKATNVTNSNAIISGEIGFVGLIPTTIGIELNDKEIYSTKFKSNGNNEMIFKCNLNTDANYTLQQGTTYKATIFTNQGGYVLNTDVVTFTTTGTSKEPTPTPEPVKSELRILPEDYPVGNIEQGSKFNLSGRIKSNCHITDVRSYILDTNKNIVQEASGWTTTATYVIENSKLDTGLNFENLNSGTYYLKYYAEDETGNTVSWISDAFSVSDVDNKLPDGDVVTATVLIPDSFENLSIRTGSSTNYEIIGSMNNTDKCKVYTDKTQNGWYYVEYNGIKGYAAGNYIYLPSETKIGTVNIPSSWDNLSIRTGASTDYQIIGSMNNGNKCTIFTDKAKNNWYFIEYNGIYGYASGNCID